MQEIIQHISLCTFFRSSLGLDYVIKWLGGGTFNCVVLLEKTDTDPVLICSDN